VADSGTLVIEDDTKRSTVSRDNGKAPTQSWHALPALPIFPAARRAARTRRREKAVLHGKMTNAPRPETLANYILKFHCYLYRRRRRDAPVAACRRIRPVSEVRGL
jgi:hypothetical protein